MQTLHPSHANVDGHRKLNFRISAKNTAWCLLGCSIGDYATILAFQHYAPHVHMWVVMPLAIVMALVSGVLFERLSCKNKWLLKKPLKSLLA